MKPVAVIDLFGGCGSAAIGFRRGGAYVIVSFDHWEAACDVHRANTLDIVMPLELGTLRAWNHIKELASNLSLSGAHVHIHASPPCQAFSVASRTDPRNGLFMMDWTLDLIKEIEPDSWSLENVLPVRKYLPDWVNFEVVNCADYGVPQTRKRVIAGDGFTLTPTHESPNTLHGDREYLPYWVTILDALPHLEGCLLDENINPNIRRRVLDEPARTITSQSAGQLRINMDGCGKSMSRRAQTTDCDLNEPAKTVKGACGPPSIRVVTNRSNPQQEAIKLRSMTMSEVATLQGFPSDFDFDEGLTQWARWTMIGNALPCQITEAIMQGLKR